MRRIPDVLDCWFESGSMPYAQVHYPFENREWFDGHFPGDFIVEYIGQTRGWFYTLHVLSTALFDKPAFETCVVHGVLLGDDGQKLSKRLQELPRPGRGVRHHRLRRHALVAAVVGRGARRRHGRRQGPDAGRGPPGAAAHLERLVLPGALRQRRRRAAARRGGDRRRPRQRARPLRAGQDPRSWSTSVTDRMDALRPLGRVPARSARSSTR